MFLTVITSNFHWMYVYLDPHWHRFLDFGRNHIFCHISRPDCHFRYRGVTRYRRWTRYRYGSNIPCGLTVNRTFRMLLYFLFGATGNKSYPKSEFWKVSQSHLRKLRRLNFRSSRWGHAVWFQRFVTSAVFVVVISILVGWEPFLCVGDAKSARTRWIFQSTIFEASCRELVGLGESSSCLRHASIVERVWPWDARCSTLVVMDGESSNWRGHRGYGEGAGGSGSAGWRRQEQPTHSGSAGDGRSHGVALNRQTVLELEGESRALPVHLLASSRRKRKINNKMLHNAW